MADTQTEVKLDPLLDAIEADIRAAFPAVETVEFDREDRTGLVCPAILLDIGELDADDDQEAGTEQLGVVLRLEALVVVGALSTPRAKREGRKLAAALATWLHMRRWNDPDPARPGKKLFTGAANVDGVSRDHFNPELDEYVAWRVDWHQTAYLGENVWLNDGGEGGGIPIPSQVFGAFAPDVGEGNAGKYDQVTP